MRKQNRWRLEFDGSRAEASRKISGFTLNLSAEAKLPTNGIWQKLGGSLVEDIWNYVEIPCGSKATGERNLAEAGRKLRGRVNITHHFDVGGFDVASHAMHAY